MLKWTQLKLVCKMFQCVASRGWKARCYLVYWKNKREREEKETGGVEEWSIVTAARDCDSEGTTSLRGVFLPWGSQVSAQSTSKSLAHLAFVMLSNIYFLQSLSLPSSAAEWSFVSTGWVYASFITLYVCAGDCSSILALFEWKHHGVGFMPQQEWQAQLFGNICPV